MRAACALAIVVVAAAGCDRAFGLDGRVASDARDVTITDLRINGTSPAIGAATEVRANIHGPASSRQTYVFTATTGMLEPAGGTADLDASGDAEIVTTYTPDQRGSVTLEATAGDASATVTFDVLELVISGLDGGTGTLSHPADEYLGARINLASARELRAIGLRVAPAEMAIGKFAVYADIGGQPAARVADLSSDQAIAPGRNEFPIPVTMLPAGNYWLVGIFDRTLKVLTGGSGTATYGFAAGSAASPMPETLTGFATRIDNQLAYFLVAAVP